MPDVRATDPADQVRSLTDLFPPYSYRWAVFDLPTRTIWFGSASAKSHLTVAEDSGLLRHLPAYYRPGPGAQMCGGYLVRSRDGAFYFDPYSGTFPGMNVMVAEAERALREYCTAKNLAWKPYDPTRREFPPEWFQNGPLNY